MQTLEGLRRQIETATDLGSVVTTMKTLAAVAIHQYERAVEALDEYNRTIELGFQIALAREHGHFFDDNTAGNTAAIVLGSDQGMCGQFNEDIVSFFNHTAASEPDGQTWKVLAIGKRAAEQLLDSGRQLQHQYVVPASVSDITNLVLEVLPFIDRLSRENDIARLLLFYNRRISASASQSQMLQLLPIGPQQMYRWRQQPWQSRSLPTYVTPRRQLVSHLVRQYLFVSVFRASAESLASENASRIAAMQAAEKNIHEKLDELKQSFHQMRQTATTEELLDVVTGFEAITKGEHNE